MDMLAIELKEGKVAPRYDAITKQLKIKKAVVTEQGMESGFPIVDFQLVDNDGNEYFIMTTGSLMNTLSAAIKGVNMRNHGVEDQP